MRPRFFILCAIAIALGAYGTASAQPDHVSYQGSLLKNGVPYDGSAEFQFAVVCGPTIVWSNEDLSGNAPTTTVSIPVDQGVFSLLLGGEPGMPPLTANLLCDDAQLRVWVDTGDGFEQMPDQRFSSAAFALKSDVAAQGGMNDGDWVVMGDDMYAGVSGSVGIGTTTPDASALLDLESQTKGFLPPRMTETERDAVAAPAEGLVIYNTTTACLNYYAAGEWLQVCGEPTCAVDECNAGQTMCGPGGFSTCAEDANGCGQWVTEDCDDGDGCTVDSCDPVLGCLHTPQDCNDEDPCTIDSCDPVLGCVNTPLNCDDDDPCTIDSCDPQVGCVHTPVNCDDSNPCTVDSCDPFTGCNYVNVNDGTPCGPNDVCSTGVCVPCTNSGGPTCGSAFYLGSICGDQGLPTVQQSGCGEGWFRIRLEECDTSIFTSADLSIRAELLTNPGGIYELELFEPCAVPAGSSSGPSVVFATVNDNIGSDETTYFFVRVFANGLPNGQNWTLRIQGNWQ